MADWGPIIGGILAGTGLGTQALAQNRFQAQQLEAQRALEQQKIGIDQQRADQLLTLQNRLLDFEREKLAASNPLLVEQAKRAALQQQGTQAASAIESRYPPAEGPMPAGVAGPGAPVSTLPPRLAAIVALAKAGLVDKPADMLVQEFPKPELKSIVDPETGRSYLQPFDPQTGQPTGQRTLQAPSSVEQIQRLRTLGLLPGQAPGGGGPPSERMIPSLDAKGEMTLRGEAAPWQHDVVRGALADMGWRPEMPGYNRAFFDAVSQLTPITEGGGAATRSQGIQPPPAGYNAPGSPVGAGSRSSAPGSTPLAVAGPAKPPEGAQIDALHTLDNAINNFQALAKLARDPEVQQSLGSLGTNPTGALARKAEEGWKVPGLGDVSFETQTPKQRQFQGLFAAARVSAMKTMEGLRPNIQFQSLLQPALSNLNDPGIADKMDQLAQYMRNNREALSHELSSARKSTSAVPELPVSPGLQGGAPEQSAPPGVPPAGPNRLSRRDPLYEHARSRGLTDEQIQKKYGITLVP